MISSQLNIFCNTFLLTKGWVWTRKFRCLSVTAADINSKIEISHQLLCLKMPIKQQKLVFYGGLKICSVFYYCKHLIFKPVFVSQFNNIHIWSKMRTDFIKQSADHMHCVGPCCIYYNRWCIYNNIIDFGTSTEIPLSRPMIVERALVRRKTRCIRRRRLYFRGFFRRRVVVDEFIIRRLVGFPREKGSSPLRRLELEPHTCQTLAWVLNRIILLRICDPPRHTSNSCRVISLSKNSFKTDSTAKKNIRLPGLSTDEKIYTNIGHDLTIDVHF